MSTARVVTSHLSKALHNYKRKYCFVGRVELKVYHVTISTLNSSFVCTSHYLWQELQCIALWSQTVQVVDCLCFFSSLSPALSLSFPVHPPPLTTLGLHAIVCWLVGCLNRQGTTTNKMCLLKINLGGVVQDFQLHSDICPKTILIWRLCFMLVVLRLTSLMLQGPSGMQSA